MLVEKKKCAEATRERVQGREATRFSHAFDVPIVDIQRHVKQSFASVQPIVDDALLRVGLERQEFGRDAFVRRPLIFFSKSAFGSTCLVFGFRRRCSAIAFTVHV